MILEEFFKKVVRHLEHSGLSTKTKHVIDSAVDDFNALDIFDRHEVFHGSRYIISKLRQEGLQGCRCPKCFNREIK